MDSNSKLDELIETQVENLIQDDDYYQALATPLKPAAIVKKEHREQLTEFFNFKEQRARFEQAQALITDLMPSFASPEAFAKVKEELNNSTAYFSHFIKSSEAESSDRPILLQEMFGLSDETLLHIYAFGRDLVGKGQFQDALALFALLTTLAPHVPSYWISEGLCFQKLNLHEEALAAFSAAKFLNPLDPTPIAYSIESHHILKENEQMKNEIESLEKVVANLDSNEKATWKERLNNYKMA